MRLPDRKKSERPREPRRRVVIPARLRSGAQWSDACIVNISSRGMMIHSGRAGPAGTMVELHRGDHVIIARVVWRDGGRAGLHSVEQLPVEEIISLGRSRGLRLAASDGEFIERRKRPRRSDTDARSTGRMLDFAGIAAIILCLALGISALSRGTPAPIARIEASLTGGS